MKKKTLLRKIVNFIALISGPFIYALKKASDYSKAVDEMEEDLIEE